MRSSPLSVAVAREWRRRWDRQQERWITDREERFEAILDVLGSAVGRRFVVLDLGCGTGSLSERILGRFPRARSVAVDHDPVLLKIARVGLGHVRGRLTYVDADLRRPEWTRSLPIRRFDAVVSTTALHWFTGAELRRLYRQLARLVRPGGWFLNGDELRFPKGSAHLRRLAHARRLAEAAAHRALGESWDDWWRAVLADPRFVDEARLHRLRYPHSHSGTPTPDLAGHLRHLRAAGFREADVVWSRWENRVLAARR